MDLGLAECHPTGRAGTPPALAFLDSPAASFIAGTKLAADGTLTRDVQV
jgi:NAD(P)-dependent dehydrogenase (short-subunit alcohol dehydrogenase family)